MKIEVIENKFHNIIDIIDVFAIYWIDNDTLCLGMPKDYGGLAAYDLAEVKIIDPVLSGRYVFYKNGIYHWSLIEERLLDDLSERDTDAYNRFLSIIKEEKLVDPDFY